jgi:uncharacterized protein YbjT (DUF2867 family)
MQPVLVTGATGQIGGAVVAELLGAGVPVRALTRRPDAARLPAAVEIVAGDLTVPESLDEALQGVGAVFLLWTAAPATVRPSSSASRRTRGASCFCPLRIERRTRSSRRRSRTRWPSSTRMSNV